MSSLRRGALIGALSALAVFFLFLGFQQPEWWLFDTYSRRLAASRPPDPRIVLVTVSEETARVLAELYGRPATYSREVYARALEELRRDGAKVVAFDILFSEANENEPEGDRMFAEQLAQGPTVLAVQTEQSQTSGVFDVTMPHPGFRNVAGVGTIRLAAAAGGSMTRHYPLGDRTASGVIPSLGAEAVRQFTGAPAAGDRQFLIRWNGTKPTPQQLSYKNIGLEKLILASLAREEGSIPASELERFAANFRGKLVLVGFTAAGLMDLRANPLSPIAPGLEIHANAVDNLLNRDFNRVANRWAMLPLILLIGAGFGAAIDRARSQLLSGLVAIAALAVVIVLGYLALVAGLVVPAFTAASAVALTYVVITVVKFVAEQQQTVLLKNTFGRYVSPQILDHILAHPEKVQLGGERRDLTILFSDIRGFTSISEASEPEEVVEMLNEYLTRMVEILLDHGGTLDKFIGDAVMGFWNAPAPDPDHARHAVACAVEMVRETARLRERWEAEGKPAIRIGIGVNTGEAVVGNIGSERVFGYTVIGDAVNLASRLEGKNKDYVTEVIVSEFTLARMGGDFETVYLDEVKVKGKERAVKIYEVKVNA